MKNNPGHSDGDCAALGPEPAAPQAALSPAVTFVCEHLAAQSGAVTISAMAAMTGLHRNTVREHLDQLVELGAATKSKAASSGRGRPAWLYRSVGTPRTGSSVYLGLASVLAAQIDRTSTDPCADGIAAGLDWGRGLAREVAENRVDTDEVTIAEAPSPASATASFSTPNTPPASTPAEEAVALLDDLGFAPEPASSEEKSTDVHSFRLTRCPLLEAAHEHPDIVCGVHLGLVRGALEAFGDPDADPSLDPFAEPGACRLHLQGTALDATDGTPAPARKFAK